MPLGLLLIVGALLVWTFVAKRTTFGRHVYAVGGNAEAARRAGINVPRIRILVFMISGAMSGLGGIVLAARLNSVDLNAGRRHAAARRDRGGGHRRHEPLRRPRRDRNALIGAALISTVSNGMFILGYSTGIIFIVTGCDPAVRRHVRHGRAAPAGPSRAARRQRRGDDPVGPHVAEPHRCAAGVAHRERGDPRRRAEPEVDARVLRREVAAARVHLANELCPSGSTP